MMSADEVVGRIRTLEEERDQTSGETPLVDARIEELKRVVSPGEEDTNDD